jgi:hypothetical protein
MYPIFFKGEQDPMPMIVFYLNPEDIINHFPDIAPDVAAEVTKCSAQTFVAAQHNSNVVAEQDLTVPFLPIVNSVAWVVDIDDATNVIDAQSREVICFLPDDEFTDANGKLIVQGRQAMHCLYAIHYVLQRNFVFDPAKNPNLCEWIVNILKAAGYENVLPIE